jgi:hypothetical protein
MSALFVIPFIIMGAGIAFYGWGLFCLQLIKYPIRNWVVTIVVGLGAFIFIGGVINLLRFAYGWSLDALLVIGILLAIKYNKYRIQLPRYFGSWATVVIIGLVIISIMCFTVKTQLPPKIFNHHDDFEKYFAHPIRMLQTGTLFGSPLNALGSETLGGQAVLHSIVINHFPIAYINGADAVFGLLLCLLLPASIFPKRTVFLPMSLIGSLMVFFINPQYVNISAIYLAAAFMMVSILLFTNLHEDEKEAIINTLPSSVLMGLIYAALIALKSIYVIFPVLHMSLFVIFMMVFGGKSLRLARWTIVTAGATVLFLLPWVLLYFPYYRHMSFAQPPLRTDFVPEQLPPFFLLSIKPLFYGASYACYTLACIVPMLIIFGVILCRRKESVMIRAGLAAGGAVPIVVYLLLLYFAPAISGYDQSLRYAVPFIIAATPMVLSIIYLWMVHSQSLKIKITFAVFTLILGALILISFSESTISRIRRGYRIGSILSYLSTFSATPKDIQYSEDVIHGDAKSRINMAQEYIPPGQAVVALVSTTFHLDYERNVIYDAERSGIATPWAYIPDVDYFLWEYRGYAVRPYNVYHSGARFPAKREQYIAEKCIAFIYSLEQLQKNADELYNDGRIVLLKKRRDK